MNCNYDLSVFRAIFHCVWKVKQVCIGFGLLHSMIGPENSHHSLNQSNAKLTPLSQPIKCKTRTTLSTNQMQNSHLSLNQSNAKLAPLSQPIKCKTNTNHDFIARVFLQFRQVTCFYFRFSLAFQLTFPSSDWPL